MEKLLNFEEFYNKYAEFRDPKTGLGCGLELLDFQKDVINHIEGVNITFIAKSRQMYMTTLMAYYTAWKVYLAYYNNEKLSVGIICQKLSNGKEIMSRIHYILCSNPIFPPTFILLKNNIKSIDFTKDISVRVSSSKYGLCGYSIDLCLMDECAYIDDLQETLRYLIPSLNIDGKIIGYSSLSRHRSHFNDMFDKNVDNTIGYALYRLHYSLNTHYTQDKLDYLKEISRDLDWSIEMEITPSYAIIGKGNKDSDENLEELLQFRVSKSTKNDLMIKLFKMSEENGSLIKLSDYLRHLVENDLKT